MDKLIFCNYNLFDLNQTVVIKNDDENTIINSSTKDLGQTIATICKDCDIRKIYLHGDANSIIKVATEIKNYAINIYNLNKLEIEVI